MTEDDSTPISDDESTVNGVRYATWTDRENGLAYVRADFRTNSADYPTLAEQPDSTSDDSASLDDFETGSVFGASGLEVLTLTYPYYTGAEKVAPYERHFTPPWALKAFDRHGYDVLDPDEMPDDDADILTDGGSDEFDVSVTVTATLPTIGRKEYTFSVTVSDPSDTTDAEETAKSMVPDDGTIEDVAVDVEAL